MSSAPPRWCYGVGNSSVNDVRAELDRENVIRRDKGAIRYATTREVPQLT